MLNAPTVGVISSTAIINSVKIDSLVFIFISPFSYLQVISNVAFEFKDFGIIFYSEARNFFPRKESSDDETKKEGDLSF
jgi:hypothetical protein